MRRFVQIHWLAVAILALSVVGCEDTTPQNEPARPEEPIPQPMSDSDDQAVEAKVLAVLAKADGMDGTADKVVTKCAGCALSMDGDPAHASKVGEYTLHLCSSDCKTMFDQNPTESVLALEVE